MVGTDYIGVCGTTIAENIGAPGTRLRENGTTFRDNSPITSARNHNHRERLRHRPTSCAISAFPATSIIPLCFVCLLTLRATAAAHRAAPGHSCFGMPNGEKSVGSSWKNGSLAVA